MSQTVSLGEQGFCYLDHTFPVFGKTFVLDKKVKKVRLYATAYGVYEVAELLGAAPQAKPLYDAVVNALNAKCKNNK